jgi:hypothetical protein
LCFVCPFFSCNHNLLQLRMMEAELNALSSSNQQLRSQLELNAQQVRLLLLLLGRVGSPQGQSWSAAICCAAAPAEECCFDCLTVSCALPAAVGGRAGEAGGCGRCS